MSTNDMVQDVPELAPFDPTKKKKKKKTTAQEFIDENAQPLVDKMEEMTVSDEADASFAGLKKKKKKPVDPNMLNADAGERLEEKEDTIEENEEANEDNQLLQPRYPWEGTDRDYMYEELLGRVFNILRENNPELAGDRRWTIMRPPQVMRE